ncbi:LBL_2463 family protein [Leptospira weilii]|uniref:LBL_2463 family protein n=1 Tax=Leptospira weilii TaxID=28184 RepID=UPI0007742E0B|nr:hypothetical protein [Leptospira weilii]
MNKIIEISSENQFVQSSLNGFQLHTWDSTQDKEIIKPVKEFSKQIYKEAGYSEYETADLDNWSKWFYVTYDGYLQAAMRIVEKTEENLIPLEIAQRYPSGEHYSLKITNVADWNSVTFKQTILGFQAFKIAAKALSLYCLDRRFKMVYGMINPTWKGLHRLYFNYGAVPSKEYSENVFFPGCLHNGKRALFQLIEIKENALQKITSELYYFCRT